MGTNLHSFFVFMPSPAPFQKTPSHSSDAFHIALLVLCAVGFLVLYFKVDLDGSLNATYMAQVSQQVERVERRLMMAEKKMNAMPSKPGMVDTKDKPMMKIQGDGMNPNGGGVMDSTGQIRMQ